MFPFIGKTTAMLRVFEKIKRAAQVDCPLLIYGEPGTGKRLVAETIHRQSCRANGPFVIVPTRYIFEGGRGDCLPYLAEQPVDSDCVCFESARDGALLIDEISQFPNTCQAKLLRIIEERHSKSVMNNKEPIHFRLIATTETPPLESIEQGTLREDLYYQLSIVTIQLPALRERKEDIPRLVHHFLNKQCAAYGRSVPQVGEELMGQLVEHPWPGNVSQLRACVEGLITNDNTKILDQHHLSLARL